MAITKAPRVRIYNASGETIPARSFVQVDADRARGDHRVYDVVKPDGTGLVYLVTENRDIASTEYGVAYNPISPVPVKHSTAPSAVEEVGPASGSWECDPGGTGFVAMRTSGNYTYVQSLGGGGGGCSTIFKMLMLGNPTGGDFDVPLTVTDGVGSSKETMTFNWDDTVTDVITELETHTKISSGDLSEVAGVNSFPNGEITFRLDADDLTLEFDTDPSGGYDVSTLTGGASWTFVSIRQCCECNA